MPIGRVRATDPGFTPTEKYRRGELLRQFVTDGPKGANDAYRSSSCWCPKCGRRMNAPGFDTCWGCAEKKVTAYASFSIRPGVDEKGHPAKVLAAVVSK